MKLVVTNLIGTVQLVNVFQNFNAICAAVGEMFHLYNIVIHVLTGLTMDF